MARIGIYLEKARCTLWCLLGKKSLKHLDICSWASSGEEFLPANQVGKALASQLKVSTGFQSSHKLIGNSTISSSKLWFANNTKIQQATRCNVWWVDQEPTLITKFQLRGFNVAHLYNVDAGGQEKAWNENLGNVGFVDFGKLNPKRSWTEPLQNK